MAVIHFLLLCASRHRDGRHPEQYAEEGCRAGTHGRGAGYWRAVEVGVAVLCVRYAVQPMQRNVPNHCSSANKGV